MTYVLAGKFRIGERLGEGGMGVVHAGHHLALDTPIAVKLLHPEDANDPGARSRFIREARRAASITGEHCVRIYDVGEEPAPHIVMEMLVGENAAERLRRIGAFNVSDAATLMIQLLDALSEAHGRGIVHRDLKPPNIFLADKPGEPIWVKILDFGIAKDVAPSQGAATTVTDLTAPHTLIGSPQYMAPEQIRAEAVDARSDLWSCGVILYELLSGRKPFNGNTLADLGAKIIGTEPAPLPNTVPAPVARMIERCLRKEPAARPQNAYDLAAALAPFATPEARGLLPRIRTWCKAEADAPLASEPSPTSSRRNTFAGGVAIVVGAGVCAFVAASVKTRTPPPMAASAAAFDPPIAALPLASGTPQPSAATPPAEVTAPASPASASASTAAPASRPRLAAPGPAPASSSGRIRTVKDMDLIP
ncbi:MAG: protein kinase [Labilithrix sp.]